jgi:hypothetical protein
MMTYEDINKCDDSRPLSLIDDVFCFAPTALDRPDLWV